MSCRPDTGRASLGDPRPTSTLLRVAAPIPNEFSRHWGAVLACFATAVFAWGFGFYGQSVYLAELHRARGWSTFIIASATTVFYLAGALGVTRVHALIARFGPRAVLGVGAGLLSLGAILFPDYA
jgi:uncharacterized integral membrane protein